MYIDDGIVKRKMAAIDSICEDVLELHILAGHVEMWDYYPLAQEAEHNLDLLFQLGAIKEQEYTNQLRHLYGIIDKK